jgi:putative DNA primase/helicase
MNYLKIVPSNIPEELKAYSQWVCWKSVPNRDGKKPDKVPYNAMTGSKAKSNDSATWASFNDAMQAYNGAGYDGLSFALSGNQVDVVVNDVCRGLNI